MHFIDVLNIVTGITVLATAILFMVEAGKYGALRASLEDPAMKRKLMIAIVLLVAMAVIEIAFGVWHFHMD